MLFSKKKKKKSESLWFSITHPGEITKESYARTVRKVTRFVILSFVLSIIVFIGVAIFGGIGNVINVLLRANLEIYALAFGAVFLGYLVSFGKWRYYMKLLGLKIPLKKNLAVYLSLYSMELTPARIGRVITAYTLNRISNIEFIDIVPVVTMDIFTDFLGMALIALIASLYFQQYLWIVVAAEIVLVLPFVFFLHPWFFKIMKKHIIKDPEHSKIFSLYGERYFTSQGKLNKPRVYLISMLFTVPSSFLYSLSLYFSLEAIKSAASVGGSVLIFSVSQIIGMLSSLPGSVGAADASLVALLTSTMGLSTATASAVTIMARAASLWFGVAMGGIFLFYTLRYWGLKSAELRRLGNNKKKPRKRKNKNQK